MVVCPDDEGGAVTGALMSQHNHDIFINCLDPSGSEAEQCQFEEDEGVGEGGAEEACAWQWGAKWGVGWQWRWGKHEMCKGPGCGPLEPVLCCGILNPESHCTPSPKP